MSMFRPRRLLGTAALVAVVALAACDPSNPVGHGPAPVSAASPSTAPATALARPTKVLTIVVENHSLDEMRRQMPYSYGLAQRFAYASGYSAITHPSLPNYLAMAGGSIFGVHDDAGPSVHPLEGPSVFDSALAAGKTARVYAEAMTSNCSTKSTGRYAVKHNPWAYFTQGRAACAAHDVPAGTVAAGALHDDIANGTLPNAGMLIPDVCDDGHDCPLSTADQYLAGWLTPILAGQDFVTGRLAVVITADEDDSSQGNRVLTAVLHRSLDGAHLVTGTALNHYSLAAFYAKIVGMVPVRDAATAADMAAAFKL